MRSVKRFVVTWAVMTLVGLGCNTQPGSIPPDEGPGEPGAPGPDLPLPPAEVLLIPEGVYTGDGEFRTTLRINDQTIPETTNTTESERFGPNGEYQLSVARDVVVGTTREFGEGAVLASVESITQDPDRMVIDYEVVITYEFVEAPLVGTLRQVFTLESENVVRMIIEATAATADEGVQFELQSDHLLTREES